MVAPPGFEPGSRDPKSRMLGRYTTGLLPKDGYRLGFLNLIFQRSKLNSNTTYRKI